MTSKKIIVQLKMFVPDDDGSAVDWLENLLEYECNKAYAQGWNEGQAYLRDQKL